MATGLLESIDRSTQLAGHNRLALLLFRLGPRQVFGINVFKVQEVIRRPQLSLLPASHRLVRGIADIRGRIVPVIDLQMAIGGEAVAAESAAHVIVTEYSRSVQGFLVNAVDRIIHVDVATVRPPPDTGGDSFLTAITQHGDELVEIIDVEKVLAAVIGVRPDLSEALQAEAQGLNPRGLKVLVADDSRVARQQIERTLAQLGVDCLVAADGQEALRQLQALAEQGDPAEKLLMVISDVEMPAMDGYRLTTEIRRDERLKGLHVLLHSSLSGVFNNAMVERVGADRFIAKFSSDDLAQAVLDRLKAVQRRVQTMH
jgi:two-component system chemotaxis response regulator CheV